MPHGPNISCCLFLKVLLVPIYTYLYIDCLWMLSMQQQTRDTRDHIAPKLKMLLSGPTEKFYQLFIMKIK